MPKGVGVQVPLSAFFLRLWFFVPINLMGLQLNWLARPGSVAAKHSRCGTIKYMSSTLPPSAAYDLIRAAQTFALKRWGSSGWSGAAAALLSDNQIITSTHVEAPVDSACLCHETGVICQAVALNLNMEAIVCVCRETGEGEFTILPPCGFCLERLAIWRTTIRIIVPSEHGWEAKTFDELVPHYWRNQSLFKKET